MRKYRGILGNGDKFVYVEEIGDKFLYADCVWNISGLAKYI